MTATELLALSPIIAAATLPVVLILAIAVHRSPALTLGLTLGGFALVLILLWPAAKLAPMQVTPLLVIDGLALLFIALATLAGAATALLAHAETARGAEEREELQVLLTLAVLGACVLGASRHFASLFLGLELLSVSLFPLLAYRRRRPVALEAAIKYLVLSSMGAGLLLFGIALLSAGSGSLEFAGIAELIDGPADIWALGGLGLVLAGLAMKLSLAPLHWWTPDVYQGGGSAVIGFLASAAKGAVIVVLLRLLADSGAYQQPAVITLVSTIAVLSMLAGNLLALLQGNLKRLLAYSSIAHMGYLLVAVLAAGTLAQEAVGFYLAAYIITTLGAFGGVALTGRDSDDPDDADIERFRGLHLRSPWLAASLTLMLLSLAGLPISAGFVGKLYLLAVGVGAALWLPLAVLVASSIIGLYSYLLVIAVMFSTPKEPAIELAPAALPASGATGLALLTLALLWLGVWPEPVIETIRAAIGALP
jgi:NADH-quinone oxidoreductase subunit N